MILLHLAALAHGADRTFAFGRLLLRDDEVLVGQATDEYRLLLTEHARSRGLPVRGAENLLFDKDESEAADLVVAANVAVECVSVPRRCELAAEWQVLDVASDTVVYQVTTRALRPYTLDEEALGRDLLVAALDRLLDRPAFTGLLTAAAIQDQPPTWDAPLPIARCTARPAALPAGMAQALGASILVRAGQRVGSGVVVSPDGFALTAAHVVDNLDTVTVELQSGLSLSAAVVRIDTAQDVAVLDIAGAGHACLPLVAREVPIGSTLYAIGAPAARGLEFSVTRGIASGYRTVEGWRLLQTDAAINPGNSGGPLISETGEVAGIVSFKLAAVGLEGLGFGVATAAVVDRLAIVPGDASAPDPAALAGRRGVAAAPAKVTDTDDPPMLVPGLAPTAGSAPAADLKYWTPGERGGLVGLLAGTAASTCIVVGTWAAAHGAHTAEGWNALGTANGAAWTVTLGLGTAATLYGIQAGNSVAPLAQPAAE